MLYLRQLSTRLFKSKQTLASGFDIIRGNGLLARLSNLWSTRFVSVQSNVFQQPNIYKHVTEHNFICSISFFYEYGNDVRPTGVMEKIQQAKRKHSQASTEAIKELIETLDSNAEDKKSNYFGTYLVLLLDGPNMYEHQNKTVLEMLNCKDIKRSVYAGKCKNDDFRAKHFTKLSSLNVLMTGNTRLFFIRKRTFKNKTDADVDEAIMIVSFFSTSLKCFSKHECKRTRFYLFRKSCLPTAREFGKKSVSDPFMWSTDVMNKLSSWG